MKTENKKTLKDAPMMTGETVVLDKIQNVQFIRNFGHFVRFLTKDGLISSAHKSRISRKK